MSPRQRILIAGETARETETWMDYLASLDCDIKVLPTAEVLEYVADWQPDLVVLDPIDCGFDIGRQIKRNGGNLKTMVLVVTQLNELGDIERAVEAGTDDFLSKPINKAEFLKRVESLLKSSGQR